MPDQHDPAIAIVVSEVVAPRGADVLVSGAQEIGRRNAGGVGTTHGGEGELPVHRREQPALRAKPRQLQSHHVALGGVGYEIAERRRVRRHRGIHVEAIHRRLEDLAARARRSSGRLGRAPWWKDPRRTRRAGRRDRATLAGCRSPSMAIRLSSARMRPSPQSRSPGGQGTAVVLAWCTGSNECVNRPERPGSATPPSGARGPCTC